MWRRCAAAEHRRMRFLNALSIAAARRARIAVLLDAVLIAAPVVAATLVAEHLTGQRRP
jgi:hypothetical protein